MMGMASKIAKNGYANLKSIGIGSSFPKSSPNQGSISDYRTLSRWKNGGANSSGKGGFRCNPILFGTRFFSNALWKGGRSNSKPPLKIPNARSYNAPTFLKGASFKWFTSTDGIVIGLIATNAAVFLLWKVADTDFMVKNFTISLDNLKSLRLHTLITSTFTHRDTFHFATNMLGLYFFGKSIGQGRLFGNLMLLQTYILGALVGPFLFLVYHSDITLPSGHRHSYAEASLQGASGAINAIVSLGVFTYTLKFMCHCPVHYTLPVPTFLMGCALLANDLLRICKINPEVGSYGVLGDIDPEFASHGGVIAGFTLFTIHILVHIICAFV